MWRRAGPTYTLAFDGNLRVLVRLSSNGHGDLWATPSRLMDETRRREAEGHPDWFHHWEHGITLRYLNTTSMWKAIVTGSLFDEGFGEA